MESATRACARPWVGTGTLTVANAPQHVDEEDQGIAMVMRYDERRFEAVPEGELRIVRRSLSRGMPSIPSQCIGKKFR